MNQAISNAPNGQPDTRDLPAPKLSRFSPLTDTEQQHAAALLLRGFTLSETARELGRSASCIFDLAKREGIEPRKAHQRWSGEEDKVLESGIVERRPLQAIADDLGRTVDAVCARINILGGMALLRGETESVEERTTAGGGQQEPWALWCAANARLRERRVITGAAC